MTSASELAITEQRQQVESLTWAWALKRAALGVAILTVLVTVLACLMYAGIEPERAEATPHKIIPVSHALAEPRTADN